MTAIPNNTSPSVNSFSKEELEQMRTELGVWAKEHALMLDLLLDAWCIVDAANRVVEMNVAFTEVCGESYRKILKQGAFCSVLQTEFCPGQCPASQVVQANKVVRWDEVGGASKAFPECKIIISGMPIQSKAGKVIGCLLNIRNVTAESVLQKKYDERKKESIIDGLTNLYNKVYTEEVLESTIKRGLRESHPVSVVMCDIDHFKKVNDTYGHQAGDYILSIVSKILKGETRETDSVGRFGGEEFVTVLFKSNAEGAKVFAERFRKKIESSIFTFQGKTIPITVSLGSASFTESWRPGLEPKVVGQELVKRADIALYYSKRTGRNRSSQHENLPPEDTQMKKAS